VSSLHRRWRQKGFDIPLYKIAHHCIDLRLNKPLWVDKPRHLHNCIHRPEIAKKPAVHLGHYPPVLNPSQQNPGADDIPKTGASLFQRYFRDLETSFGLSSWIAHANSLSIRTQRSSAGYRYDVSYPHSPGNANYRLIRAAGRYILSIAH
jgi:hypothetical protein